MKVIQNKLLISFIGLQLCCSCGIVGHGFDRDEMKNELALQVPTITDEDIKKASAAKSDLFAPFSVGVFYRESRERDPTNTRSSQWTDLDRKIISEALQKLKDQSLISDYLTLSPLLISTPDLKSLLLAAALSHVDVVLQISGIGAVDVYENVWAIAYLPIFTLSFVHGTNVDALYKLKADLWDVKNNYLLFNIDFENIKKEKRPGWFRHEQEILNKAKTQAMDSLKTELFRKFESLKKSPRSSDTQAIYTLGAKTY